MAAEVDQNTCTGCGLCVDTCPVSVIVMQEDNKALVEDGCIDCGACVEECPVDAISLK